MSSDYDGQDQAYKDLLAENQDLTRSVFEYTEVIIQLTSALENIAALIHYQSHLKHQDNWLADVIEQGLVTLDEDDDDE
tara:strand:- start:3701 stop:3937 length:237 start_codon:yes stop_codon:yes gene_type:complete